jgi:hypothetical protein
VHIDALLAIVGTLQRRAVQAVAVVGVHATAIDDGCPRSTHPSPSPSQPPDRREQLRFRAVGFHQAPTERVGDDP